MRKWPIQSVIAMVAALAFSTAGHADPWNGFYVGAFAGGAWGDTDTASDAGTFIPAVTYFTSSANADSVAQNASGSSNSRSFTGGAQIGVNQRFGQVVAGVEIDFGRLNINASRGAENVTYPTFAAANYSVRAAVETDWLLTTRGRLGWLVSRQLLVYATGGLAVSDVEISNSFADDAGSFGIGGASAADTKVGYTIGGGLELALDKAWSIKGEYLYLDLGSTSVYGTIRCGGPCSRSGPFNSSTDLTASIARVGINYSFTD